MGNSQTLESMTSSLTLLHIKSFTCACFIKILFSVKMIFGQVQVQLKANIPNLFLVLT